MSSTALGDLKVGLAEIDALQRANPTPSQGGGLKRPTVTRAIGRAQVVLLCSHLERYLYALSEEMCEALVRAGITSERLPSELRLLHSKAAIDVLSATNWDHRETQLVNFAAEDAGLWRAGDVLTRFEADRLLAWMKTPSPENIERIFRQWGQPGIFAVIAVKPSHRSRIRLKLGELVAKRNNIAHGDFTVEAGHLDISGYRRAVREFCERADGRSARIVSGLTGARPW